MPHRRQVLAFVLLVGAQALGILGLSLCTSFSLFGETPPPVSTSDAVLGLLSLAGAVLPSAIAFAGWPLVLFVPFRIADVPLTAILATVFAVRGSPARSEPPTR
jgi:hypothetical protein